jgi:hypothetical protein
MKKPSRIFIVEMISRLKISHRPIHFNTPLRGTQTLTDELVHSSRLKAGRERTKDLISKNKTRSSRLDLFLASLAS